MSSHAATKAANDNNDTILAGCARNALLIARGQAPESRIVAKQLTASGPLPAPAR